MCCRSISSNGAGDPSPDFQHWKPLPEPVAKNQRRPRVDDNGPPKSLLLDRLQHSVLTVSYRVRVGHPDENLFRGSTIFAEARARTECRLPSRPGGWFASCRLPDG